MPLSYVSSLMSNTLTKLKVSVDKSVRKYKHRHHSRKNKNAHPSTSSRTSVSSGFKSTSSSQKHEPEEETPAARPLFKPKIRVNSLTTSETDSACETLSLQDEKSTNLCIQSPTRSAISTTSAVNTELATTSGVNSMSSRPSKATSLFDLIIKSEIGNGDVFLSPFGLRKIFYCDYTASGRSLSFIEDYITKVVLPVFASASDTSSGSKDKIEKMKNDARDMIAKCVNAQENDAIIFGTNGCTNAIHKLINALSFAKPPVVFISLVEHHSNILPWREINAKVVTIEETKEGYVDLNDLRHKLVHYTNSEKYASRVKIGCFSAASNVTGILADVEKITVLLHSFGALSFWDYACGAPYLKIDMNPEVAENENDAHLVYKDAVYFSTHKFVGGPQTPGILIAKKYLLKKKIDDGYGKAKPLVKNYAYFKEEEEAEQAGTSLTVEIIRAGLVFHLKQTIGEAAIDQREEYYSKKAKDFFREIPNLKVLGSLSAERLTIFSFLIKNEATGLYLHTTFVTKILNDLFGILSRSGCACAGPYAAHLLNINLDLARMYIDVFLDYEIYKPGFTRLNIPFFVSEKRVDFLLEAIKFVCEHGWKFLPLYTFKMNTGEWIYKGFQPLDDIKQMKDISYENNRFHFEDPPLPSNQTTKFLPSDHECMKVAYETLKEVSRAKIDIEDQRPAFDQISSRFRWFLLPSEAYGLLHSNKKLYGAKRILAPIEPRFYRYYAHEEDEDEGYY